ncbi:hypothetical protein GCM10022631_31150 [Deinococcus rubellus]|uniref:Cell division protein FtsL n=1 Tax=Deinococcus rubellus TaxID=1889240 RepID=A0ABY5YEF4_9DEIO|nr:hypothetical protein [Deinococcus rubellus]UWX63455.1 hypothetical protein N0D28_11975 [Deinococcus rubellus]
MSRPLPLQASLSVWRARALRYTSVYVLLAAALLGLRYATRETYPHLRELRINVLELQNQRDHLELEVQTLTTGPRVLEWAAAQGMVPYAQAPKTSADIPALPALPAPPPEDTSFQVSTRWSAPDQASDPHKLSQ